MLAWLVCVLVLGASALTVPNCDATRPTVLECVQELLDLDHNGIITPVEIAVALQTTFTFVPDFLTWQFVMRCDLNEDGVLTMADWTIPPPNMTCLPTQNCLDIACSICAQNGFVQTKRQAPPQPVPPPRDDLPPIHRVVAPEVIAETMKRQEEKRALAKKQAAERQAAEREAAQKKAAAATEKKTSQAG